MEAMDLSSRSILVTGAYGLLGGWLTAALVEACWGLSMQPEQLVKLSGIGCSSKTTAYFVSGAHGFNSVHGRMPSIASGANAANRGLTCENRRCGNGDSVVSNGLNLRAKYERHCRR